MRVPPVPPPQREPPPAPHLLALLAPMAPQAPAPRAQLATTLASGLLLAVVARLASTQALGLHHAFLALRAATVPVHLLRSAVPLGPMLLLAQGVARLVKLATTRLPEQQFARDALQLSTLAQGLQVAQLVPQEATAQARLT